MRRSILACVFAAAACGSGSDPNAPDADPNAPDANPNAPDAGGPGPDAAPTFPSCLETCSSSADCGNAASPITDADNYACEGSRCRWLGCNSTSECTAAYGAGYICGTVAGYLLPSCFESCSSPAECVIAGSVLFDVDNWTCDTGKCRWAGCTSTSECATAYMDPDWSCAPSGAGWNTCWPTCSTATDCGNPASPLIDADNYACEGGRCRWQGCNTTAECTSAYMSPDWVCEPI